MAVVSMSKQECGRLEVLLQVQSGRLRVADACVLIGLHRHQVFRCCAASQRVPAYPTVYRVAVYSNNSSYAHPGRLDEAREVVARLRTVTPVVIPNVSFLRNLERRELLLSACDWPPARRDKPEATIVASALAGLCC